MSSMIARTERVWQSADAVDQQVLSDSGHSWRKLPNLLAAPDDVHLGPHRPDPGCVRPPVPLPALNDLQGKGDGLGIRRDDGRPESLVRLARGQAVSRHAA